MPDKISIDMTLSIVFALSFRTHWLKVRTWIHIINETTVK